MKRYCQAVLYGALITMGSCGNSNSTYPEAAQVGTAEPSQVLSNQNIELESVLGDEKSNAYNYYFDKHSQLEEAAGDGRMQFVYYVLVKDTQSPDEQYFLVRPGSGRALTGDYLIGSMPLIEMAVLNSRFVRVWLTDDVNSEVATAVHKQMVNDNYIEAGDDQIYGIERDELNGLRDRMLILLQKGSRP